MNKIVLSILLLVCLALVVYNATKLNLQNVFEGESLIAVIGILAALCAALILVIFQLSKKIQDKLK